MTVSMMPIKSVCEIRHQSKRKKLPVSSIQKNLYTVNVGGGQAPPTTFPRSIVTLPCLRNPGSAPVKVFFAEFFYGQNSTNIKVYICFYNLHSFFIIYRFSAKA